MIRRDWGREREREIATVAACKNSKQPNEKQLKKKKQKAARKGSQKTNDNRLKVFRISGILSSVAKTFYQTRTTERGEWQKGRTDYTEGRLHIEAKRCTCCICLLRVAFRIVRHLLLAKIQNMLYSTLGKVRWNLLYWKRRKRERERYRDRARS